MNPAGHVPADHTTNTRQGAPYLMTSTNRAVALRAVPQTDTGRIGATFSAWAPLAGDGQEAVK